MIVGQYDDVVEQYVPMYAGPASARMRLVKQVK